MAERGCALYTAEPPVVSDRRSELQKTKISLHRLNRFGFYALFDHILAVAHTTSRIFSWWLTIVRMLRLAIVKGGVSLGAFGSVSAKGLMSFGSVTVTSNLHQETYAEPEQGHDLDFQERTPLYSTWGFLIWSQQGPMILRFRTRSSNALVLVPNIREKVGLDTFAGIWGSGNRTYSSNARP
jgi:hypothetical protein